MMTNLGTNIQDRRLKKYKEAWIGAVATLALAQEFEGEWWVQIPKIDPPDALNMTFKENDKGSWDMSVAPIEVFEINPTSDISVEDCIREKIGSKDYSGMFLVGYLRKTGTYDVNQISANVISKQYNLLGISLLTLHDVASNGTFVQLAPIGAKVSFNYEEMCATSTQRDFVKVERSTRHERTDYEFPIRPTLIPE